MPLYKSQEREQWREFFGYDPLNPLISLPRNDVVAGEHSLVLRPPGASCRLDLGDADQILFLAYQLEFQLAEASGIVPLRPLETSSVTGYEAHEGLHGCLVAVARVARGVEIQIKKPTSVTVRRLIRTEGCRTAHANFRSFLARRARAALMRSPF